MTNTPLVSIIIPTYNRAHLIGETLDSVLTQTYTNWECIVVDDGSTDNTAEVLKKYCHKDKRIQYHLRPVNKPKGGNVCRNYGFELSKGEFINWFDSDDIMCKDKLLLQVKSIHDTNFNFSVCNAVFFEETPKNIVGFGTDTLKTNNVFKDCLMLKVAIMTPSVLWRKKHLESMEYLFDETLQAAQEWEFNCRVLNGNPDYTTVDINLVLVRKHASSISYNSNFGFRKWHYFLARFKVYDNVKVLKKTDELDYLEFFMLDIFIQMIRKFYLKYAYKILRMFVLKSKRMSLKSKIYSVLVLLSFKCFKKGDVLLKKVTLK